MENNSIIGVIPWPVTAATAAWFGFMAYKAGKNCVVWAIGGGVLALVVTTLVMGLGQATFIPYDSEQVPTFRLEAAVVAILLVFCLGWLFTGSLHQHLRESWKQPEEGALDAPAKGPAPGAKL
jgi:hypothetical protein